MAINNSRRTAVINGKLCIVDLLDYEFAVKDGPSKFDLMTSLFAGRDLSDRLVTFDVEGLGKVQAMISSVMREDNSGESWNITAYLEDGLDSGARIAQGYFSTKSRRGTIRFATRL